MKVRADTHLRDSLRLDEPTPVTEKMSVDRAEHPMAELTNCWEADLSTYYAYHIVYRFCSFPRCVGDPDVSPKVAQIVVAFVEDLVETLHPHTLGYFPVLGIHLNNGGETWLVSKFHEFEPLGHTLGDVRSSEAPFAGIMRLLKMSDHPNSRELRITSELEDLPDLREWRLLHLLCLCHFVSPLEIEPWGESPTGMYKITESIIQRFSKKSNLKEVLAYLIYIPCSHREYKVV